jgi:hypothetical protein
MHMLVVLGLLASVGLSAGFALALYRDDRAAALRRAAQLHSVEAVLVTAPARAVASDPVPGAAAQVRWTGPGGAVHQQNIAVQGNATVGARIRLWLDPADRVTGAPVTAGESAVSAGYLGILGLLGSLGLVAGTDRVLRHWADRTDERHWGQDWRLFEPVWTHHS